MVSFETRWRLIAAILLTALNSFLVPYYFGGWGQKTGVGFAIVALGAYNDMIEDLVYSINRHFCSSGQSFTPEIYLFTDAPSNFFRFPKNLKVVVTKTEKKGWPHDSMNRVNLYLDNRRLFEHSVEYMFSIDADMKMNSNICQDILGKRVAVHVPWFWKQKREEWPFETRNESVASVSETERQTAVGYFSGAFFGGTVREFLAACDAMKKMQLEDMSKEPHVVPVWHDESYLNRYFIDFPPMLALNGFYLYPETPGDYWLLDSYPNIWLHNDQRAETVKIIHRTKTNDIIRRSSLNQKKTNSSESLKLQVYDRITIGIKAHERPDCVKRLLVNIYTLYPQLHVIVADDSLEPDNKWYVKDNPKLSYHWIGYDVGLAGGRNFLVNATNTPYILVLDEDSTFGVDTFALEKWLQVMEATDVDLLGGCTVDSASGYHVSLSNNTLQVAIHKYGLSDPLTEKEMLAEPSLLRTTDNIPVPLCYHSNMTQNLFLAKTSTLKKVQWDAAFKLGEHEDFFLRMTKSGAKIAFCRAKGFWINNDHNCVVEKSDKLKYSARRGRQFYFWRFLFQKYNLTSMVTPAGTYKMKCSNSSLDSCEITTTQDYIWWEEDTPDEFFEQIDFPTTTTEHSLHLDGASCLAVSQPQLSFNGNLPFTVEMWFYVSQTNHIGQLAAKFSVGDKGEFHVFYSAFAVSFFRECPPWNALKASATRHTLPIRKWHHMAAVFDGSKRYLYLDGQLMAKDESGTVWSKADHIPISIGCIYDKGVMKTFFTGAIDDVRIWNRSRSEQEITRYMNIKLTGKEEGLAVYLPFDGGTIEAMTNHTTVIPSGTVAFNKGVVLKLQPISD